MYRTIVSAIHTVVGTAFAIAYPTIPMVFENQPFDWANPPDRFVTVEVKFYGGRQIGASATPKTRSSGYVYVEVMSRDGTGSLNSLDILDSIAGTLKYASLGPVRLQAPTLGDTNPIRGWHTECLKVPFYADDV